MIRPSESVHSDGFCVTGQFYDYPQYGSPYQSYLHRETEHTVFVLPSDNNEGDNQRGEPITKNAGSRWREDETMALVEIWRDKICQTRWWKQSKGVRVNKEIWEEIAQLLSDKSIHRTPNQCQIRMKNLLQFYRQTIDNHRSEKSMDELPEYFEIVDVMMTRREGCDDDDTVQSSTRDGRNSIGNIDKKEYLFKKQNEKEEQTPDVKTRKARDTNSHEASFQCGYSRNGVPKTLNSLKNESKNATLHSDSPKSVINCCDLSHRPTEKVNRGLSGVFQDATTRYEPYARQYVQASRRNQSSANYVNCVGQPLTHSSKSSAVNCTENEWNFCNNTVSLKFIQELLNLQYKQMENFLEIEKKRLEIEQKRLLEERDAYSRNSGFLMEAVKILAESYRKSE